MLKTIKLKTVFAVLLFVCLVMLSNIFFNQSHAFQLHNVNKNETMFKIASQYGVGLKELQQHNQLENYNMIFPGQAILIPRHDTDIHVVEKGDTLSSISNHYGFTLDELVDLNDIKNKDLIFVGQEIILPRTVTKPPWAGDEEEFDFTKTRFPGDFFLKGSTGGKKIALTFDDGPDQKYTPETLNILDDYGVPATFYYVGENIQKNPEVFKKTVEKGHEIGNHSWSHKNLRYLSEEKFKEEINKTNEIIKKYTNEPEVRTIRPPYGDINDEKAKMLIDKEFKIVNWSMDTWDWWNKDADKILINVLKDLHQDGIILMHSSGSTAGCEATVEALPQIIYNLKLRGYEFVTISEIIE